jgi:hypothetical protein
VVRVRPGDSFDTVVGRYPSVFGTRQEGPR